MAERRMFTKKIVDSDVFLDMPLSTQALYFHLSMRADDEGFTNNPKKIMRMIGASEDDMKVLIAKKFIIVFDSGVIVIKHWRMHNYIQSDRFHQTDYKEERSQLYVKDNKSYGLIENAESTEIPTVYTECIQNESKMLPEVRLDKNRLVKEKEINKEKEKRFKPPTVEEVKAYCKERKNSINAEAFIDFYESKGWFVGKNKMKDWKAAVRNWERNEAGKNRQNTSNAIQPKIYKEFETEDYERPDFERASMPSEIRNKLSGMFGGV